MFRSPWPQLFPKNIINLKKKTKKRNSRQMLGQGRPGKNSDKCFKPMAKIGPFSRLGEEHRTPGVTSRHLDHGSTRCLRGRHLHSLDLPDTMRVGHGFILSLDRRSIAAWAVFDVRVDIFNVKARVPPRADAWTKLLSCFSRRFSHSGGTRVASAAFVVWIVWKQKIVASCFH